MKCFNVNSPMACAQDHRQTERSQSHILKTYTLNGINLNKSHIEFLLPQSLQDTKNH